MINKGNTKEILINNNDVKLKNASKDFLKILEKYVKKYVKKYDDLNTINKKYKEDNSYYFIPEKLTKKSPLTIINGPWGSGKTHFIENFLKLFIDSDIKSNIFKKMTIIDAWRFSDSKDVPIQFIFELSQILLKINNIKLKKGCFKSFLNKIFNKLAPTSFVAKLDFGLLKFESHWNENEKNNEKEKSEKEALNIIRNNHEKTIIFIDNLERLGSFSWDLLKSVLKLQEFKNYLIILALNSNKLKNNEIIKNNKEYPIEKYIDITMFDFEQNYYSYFYNETKDENESEILESIFNEEINGKKLSIREVEQSCESNNLFKEKKLYNKFFIIFNRIWNAKNTIEKIFINDIMIFIKNWKNKHKEINIFKDKIIQLENDYDEEILKIFKDVKKPKNKILDFDNNNTFFYLDFEQNYVNEMKKINKYILLIKDKINNEIIKNNEDINKKNVSIKEKNKNIFDQKERISMYEKEIENENNKKEGHDSQVLVNNENKIEKSKNWINEWDEDIKNLKGQINGLDQKKEKFEFLINRKIYQEIEVIIDNVKNFDNKLKNILSSKIFYILEYIKNLFYEYDKKFKEENNVFIEKIKSNILLIIKEKKPFKLL